MPQAHTRNRQDMEKLIDDGSSVMLPDGRIITRKDDLPDEAALAAGDRCRLEAERDRLKKVIGGHAAELKEVEKKIATLPAEPKAEPDAKGDGKPDMNVDGKGEKPLK